MRIILQIFLFGIAFFCTIALSEVFIRTTHIASVSPTEFYDDIGRGRRKGLNFLYFNEGFGIGKFNEYRYIGEANPPEKPKNTIRIALMGDSYIESFQIFDRDYFGNVAENILKKEYPKARFEFLNFGRSGFDIADIYAYQKTLVEIFNPDFILYMVSNSDLEPKYTDPLRPKTLLDNDSLLVSFDFVTTEIKMFEKTKFLTQNVSIFSMLNDCRKKTKITPLLAILFEKIYTWIEPSQIIMDHHYDDNSNYQINPVTKRIIETLDPQKVVFVNRDIFELPREFKKICCDNGYAYFDLSRVLNLMKESGNDPIEWKVTGKTGHWTPNAHKVIGNKIAKDMKRVIENE